MTTPTKLSEILKTFRGKSLRAFDPPAENYELGARALDEAETAILKLISEEMDSVIGEDTPRKPQKGFKASFTEAAKRTVENQLKSDQRARKEAWLKEQI